MRKNVSLIDTNAKSNPVEIKMAYIFTYNANLQQKDYINIKVFTFLLSNIFK
jgi:hypothetical protein